MRGQSSIFLFVCIAFFFCSEKDAEAQQAVSTCSWGKYYGSTTKDEDVAFHISADGENGYVMAGYSKSKGAGNGDAWLIKTDLEGDMLWDKVYGGPEHDAANLVLNTSDGSHILIGTTQSKGEGKTDLWLLKVDSDGKPIWDKTYGNEYNDKPSGAVLTGDGGFAVSGYEFLVDPEFPDSRPQQHIFLKRFDSKGNIMWKTAFAQDSYNESQGIILTMDGGFAIIGNTLTSNKMVDAWLIVTDADGNQIWEKTFGGVKWDEVHSIAQLDDASFVLGGATISEGKQGDIWLFKVNTIGMIEWETRLPADGFETVKRILPDKNGSDFSVLANASALRSTQDLFMVINLNGYDGNLNWSKLIGDSFLHKAYDFLATDDGGFLVLGSPFEAAGCRDKKPQKAFLMKLAPESSLKE